MRNIGSKSWILILSNEFGSPLRNIGSRSWILTFNIESGSSMRNNGLRFCIYSVMNMDLLGEMMDSDPDPYTML